MYISEMQKEKVMKIRIKYQIAAALLVLCLSGIASGQEREKKQAADEKFKEVVQKFAQYVQGLPGYSVTVTSIIQIDNSPLMQKTREEFSLAMRRPDRLALVHKKGTMGPSIVCDGVTISTYYPQLNQYVLKPSPLDYTESLSAADNYLSF